MKIVADIHLHSHFSRATSKSLNLEHCYKWAQLKGVQVVGTGDIAHPEWLEEMEERLDPAEDGLFKLKPEFAEPLQAEIPQACVGTVRFLLAGEISNIYKKNDKVRKIHNVVFMPSFAALRRFQATLDKIGNIRSDGRPILGLDARDLLEIVLETDPRAHLIPAHIWTPWFSLLGSMSGFDTVEECFEDLTNHIFAVETGLSSDPPMNWRLSMLDKYTLVSNSDAHSPQKLAREANLFNVDLSYNGLFDALKTGDPKQFLGTIEFFPEEGKYHYDGHRKCDLRWDPRTTLEHDCICPKCGKKVTVGVMHRVEVLADRDIGEGPARRHPYKSLVPLPEVLAEIYAVGPNTKRVRESHDFLLGKLGAELSILQDIPLEDLDKLGGALLSEGIRRMRQNELRIAAGYDGKFGTIHLFTESERKSYSKQLEFFKESVKKEQEASAPEALKVADKQTAWEGPRLEMKLEIHQIAAAAPVHEAPHNTNPGNSSQDILAGLNAEQLVAVQSSAEQIAIVAGPGTGKTTTLTHRIAHLVVATGVAPHHILAITFTNKAADEMAGRLHRLLESDASEGITVMTFHALCARILLEHGSMTGISSNFSICDNEEKLAILQDCCADLSARQAADYLEAIAAAKNRLITPDTSVSFEEFHKLDHFTEIYRAYESAKGDAVLDYEDLVLQAVTLLRAHTEILDKYRRRFRWISVDEYQDLNLAQYELLMLLAKTNNLCVIGDPDQAIYGFRGGSAKYFLEFEKDFPKAQILRLKRNYRSTKLLVDASTQVIATENPTRGKNLWSEIVSQRKVEIIQAPTEHAEAEQVVHQVEKLVGGTSYFSIDSGRVSDDENNQTTSFADVAVLYRLSAQAKALETAFKRSGIPYHRLGTAPLLENPDIKRLIDCLWFCNNPQSDKHLLQIIRSTSNGIGSETLQTITKDLAGAPTSLWQYLCDRENQTRLRLKEKKIFKDFMASMHGLTELRTKATLEALTRYALITVFYGRNHFHKQSPLREQLSKLLLRTHEQDLGEFLGAVSTSHEIDEYDPRADRVTLMTIHAAKGLEFPVVFITGCEESLIPYRHHRELDLAEERRLLYVGMTRAESRLILTHAGSRVLFGKKVHNQPSRFLRDISDSLKEVKRSELPKKAGKGSEPTPQMNLF